MLEKEIEQGLNSKLENNKNNIENDALE